MFALNDAQKQEVIAQADSHMKTAKGRGYRRQVTRAEVVHLLSDLPRDAAGLVSFHDAQKLILGYREEQIERFKVIFPQIVTGSANKKQHRTITSPADDINSGNATAHSAEEGGPGKVTVGIALASAKRAPGGRALDDGAKRGGRLGRRAMFSADVAPAEMFVKDMGLTPAGIASHVSLRFFLLKAVLAMLGNNFITCTCSATRASSYAGFSSMSVTTRIHARLNSLKVIPGVRGKKRTPVANATLIRTRYVAFKYSSMEDCNSKPFSLASL